MGVRSSVEYMHSSLKVLTHLSFPFQIPRIATDIRIGTRVDKPDKQQWAEGLGENERKRESVRRTLANKTQQ